MFVSSSLTIALEWPFVLKAHGCAHYLPATADEATPKKENAARMHPAMFSVFCLISAAL